MSSLRITEIFHSLQGEGKFTGLPTVFVRLTGCPLRCSYCDTAYAFHGGSILMLDQVLEKVASYPARHVCVTGGEPLAQKHCLDLLGKLCDATYNVSLETSGAMPIKAVDERVCIVMDLKTPSSGEVDKNLMENLDHLQDKDQLKFVIANHEDYLWSKAQLESLSPHARPGEVLFSPVFGEMDLRELSQWILDDGLAVRLQVQLHKLIWQDETGR